MGVLVTKSAMMHAGRRIIGPPLSHAHWPSDSCRREKYERPLRAAPRGVRGVGRLGRPWAICDVRLMADRKGAGKSRES